MLIYSCQFLDLIYRHLLTSILQWTLLSTWQIMEPLLQMMISISQTETFITTYPYLFTLTSQNVILMLLLGISNGEKNATNKDLTKVDWEILRLFLLVIHLIIYVYLHVCTS